MMSETNYEICKQLRDRPRASLTATRYGTINATKNETLIEVDAPSKSEITRVILASCSKGNHKFIADGRWTKCSECDVKPTCHMCRKNRGECLSELQNPGGMVMKDNPYGYDAFCPLIHFIRFGINDNGDRYVRCLYWLYVWVIPLTYFIWIMPFLIIRNSIVLAIDAIDYFAELEGQCACRGLIFIPIFIFFPVAIALMFLTQVFAVPLWFITSLMIPCIFAATPATWDDGKWWS